MKIGRFIKILPISTQKRAENSFRCLIRGTQSTGRTEETPPVRLVLTRREVELLAQELAAVARHMGEKIVCEAW